MPDIQAVLVHLQSLLDTLARSGHLALASATPEDLLLAARATFLVFCFLLAAVTFTRWRRAAERDTAHTADGLAQVLARLERLERLVCENEPRLTALGEQLEAHFNGAAGAARESYPIAIRLARAGAAPAELAASCGLSRQEAELVARLHGRRRESGGPQPLAIRGRSAAA